jgi:hypothetical protein
MTLTIEIQDGVVTNLECTDPIQIIIWDKDRDEELQNPFPYAQQPDYVGADVIQRLASAIIEKARSEIAACVAAHKRDIATITKGA